MAIEQFSVQGPSYDECVKKVQRIYGERAKVMNYRAIEMGGLFGTRLFAREGVEVTGYISQDLRYAASGGYGGTAGMGASFRGQTGLQPQASPRAQTALQTQTGPHASQTLDFEEEKKKLLATAAAATNKPDPTLQKLLAQVETLAEKIDANVRPQDEEHATLGRLAELFEQNDFSHAYAKMMVDRARKEFSLDALEDFDAVQDRVVEWIGETITIHPETPNGGPDRHRPGKPRILVLVGPTGVGKTTTIAKLAFALQYGGFGQPPMRVKLITIDGYRIAAREQLEKYGDIMNIPVSYVQDGQELRKTIAFYQDDADIILVDTIGKSPRDAVELGKMKAFLDACGSSAEVHLAMTAGTKYSDAREILRQFAPFNYQSAVVTKLDETIRVGNVISALFADGKPVSYVTDGQGVEKYIHRASVVRFLINLEGFRINREAIEARFSPAGEK